MTNDQQQAMQVMLDRVHAERLRQHELYGEQDHRDVNPILKQEAATFELEIRELRRFDHKDGNGTWFTILWSEVAEAANATDDLNHLQEELVQLAAVCVQWAEAIERRKR